MNNFVFYNPTRIVFGKGTIARLSDLVMPGTRVLLLFGSGSIKGNGIYDKVTAALGGRIVVEQGGILPNPTCEQCDAIQQKVQDEGIEWILAVGGGSVIDAAKYIAAAAKLPPGESVWTLIEKRTPVQEALPMGVVVTIPASGSEMNANAVISSTARRTKRSLKSEKIFPVFAILDPEVTRSLSPRQIANGVVDAYAHVLEQYLTFPSEAPLQDRFSEGILSTLIEVGPECVSRSCDDDRMAAFMWAAACASSGFASCGVPQDWSSHLIGHELTAEYGLAHPESVGIVLPGVIEYMEQEKREKLSQYGRRVWGLAGTCDEAISRQAIRKTEEFFVSLGQPVRLSDFGLGAEAAERISKKIGRYPAKIGERKTIGEKEVKEILLARI